MTTATLADMRHRADYHGAAGRDRWTVRHVHAFVSATLTRTLAASAPSAAVLDAGCGEQPFRGLVEAAGRTYVGMDVAQNGRGSVDILSTLEDAPAFDAPFPIVLCTEVIEHVVDVDAAFAGLRRACVPGATVVMTAPFVFPLHMEPFDFRRLTLDGIERLASRHGFVVESAARLGSGADVLSTLLSDASYLPTTDSLYARAKVRAARAVTAAALGVLNASFASSNMTMNSNLYLTNGVVLRAA
jgi:Methyltransferase domain